MKKSAKELFEWLGYKLDDETEGNTVMMYCHDILDKSTLGYVDSEVICFNYEEQSVEFTNMFSISLDELQAINKQVEELWGDR
jgi:hypothetical protein